MKPADAITCEALTRRFGDTVAVDGLDLSVRPGEMLALLGPNGAGKSTTVHMLTTMLPPTSGRGRVMGLDVTRHAREVRSLIGVVFQEPALDDRLTAWENLEFHAVLYGIAGRHRREAIQRALEWAELQGRAHHLVRTFSGGMKRRLELARALMHGPAVLFLDEPTLGLDPQGRRKLWEQIAALRSRGVTTLLTTHNMLEAEQCDRVAIIDRGQLLVVDTPSALKERSLGGPTLEDVFLQLTGRQLRDPDASPREWLLSFGRRGGEHTR
ncbi:ATP-binding cassette domain-containing protein [Carboxydochorda subterranea]|uniref:ATP-binding cassette domain-containing protein n=1 Tax=Carboxydichorda subterranea TaxID=3109565 RepID=A0ABZ1BXK5_9FIRM|nr:ATP-binding cassette domain-containing protein [Limnochorda sp. L945t]WRP17355.1 ATP-binding cassette domain-containing protein [Limnochorda sp. L945t]